MFGIGETEFVIILIFGFLLFGPDKLPGIGRTIGRVLRQFREASEGFTEVVQTNVIDPATQELNNTGSNKRTPAAAQAKPADVDDDDADIEDGAEGASSEPAPKRETFAERKARLQAERAAREAAAAEKATAAQDSDDEDADVDEAGAAGASAAVKDAPAAKAEGMAEKATPSVADLYSRGSRRSSRAQAEDAEAAAPAEVSPATEPPADVTPDADQAQADGGGTPANADGEEGESHA